MGLVELLGFPCTTMPEEPACARLLGIYPYRPEGLFFQRVRVPGGRIQADQWLGLAALAARYTPGHPMHVTTRQDIELHGVRPTDVPAVQHAVRDLGLSCAGACGDTVRNVTFCPGSGLRRGTWDVAELAESIQSCVEAIPWIAELPRKFKISVCGCFESCTRPWINDLGLVANRDGTFRAIVAGSLGPRPGTGMVLEEAIPVEHVRPLVVALLRLFHVEGDRTRRHRARLRHVRERLGEEAFVDHARALFQAELARASHDTPRVEHVVNDTPLQAHLLLPSGNLMPEVASELGRTVRQNQAQMRIGFEHDLFLHGPQPIALSLALQVLSNRASVVACPGATWCTKGIADSRGAAERIGRRLPPIPGLSVAVSGCPNNCSQAVVTSIGLIGCIRRIEGSPVKGFQVLVGGGQGRDPQLAREVCPFVAADDIDEAVAWIVEEYRRAAARDAVTEFNAFVSHEFHRLARTLEDRYGNVTRMTRAAAG